MRKMVRNYDTDYKKDQMDRMEVLKQLQESKEAKRE